jgi:general stress protein 26
MTPSTTEELKTFQDLLSRFDTGMLITHAGNNDLHGRPMAVAQVDEQCDVWFVADIDSPKMTEIRSNDQVMVTFQNKRDEFVTLTGRAELLRDPQKIDEIWQEGFKAWFPGGKTDPNLGLIHIRAVEGEYWNNAGANKVSYLFESLRAYAQGDKPHIQEGTQHGRVSL